MSVQATTPCMGRDCPVLPSHKGTMFKSLRLSGGVLQRGWKEPATVAVRWQVVVPKAFRNVVLHTVHGTPGSGDFGLTHWVWQNAAQPSPGLLLGPTKTICGGLLLACDECTARRGPPARSRAELQQFPVGLSMERVGIDVLGPFVSRTGVIGMSSQQWTTSLRHAPLPSTPRVMGWLKGSIEP